MKAIPHLVLIYALATLSPMESQAQFKKYQSKTKVRPAGGGGGTAGVNSAPPNQLGNENDVDEQEEQFGRGTGVANVNLPKPSEKYVNLNPETAFGPEVITSFDFPDTDILELTKHMQKLTGINLILDKDVKGKISITAPTPITVGDAWKAYLTALNLNGYTLVKAGAFYKILKTSTARYYPTKIYTGNYTPDTENFVMRIIALKYINASEISRNFRQFMSNYGRIVDLKQTNTILIYETGANINSLLRLIKYLDVPGHEETLQIIKVEHSSAQEIAKLLDNILKGNNRLRAGVSSGGGQSNQSISKIIAEPRTNSIIAMANAEGAKQLRDLILKLDVRLVSKGGGQIHVYYLNYGDAETLSKTLSSLVSNSTNNAANGATRFTTRDGSSDSPLFSSQVKITADKANNALVVMASPTDYLTMKQIIAKLDIPRQQVFVEGLIMETNVTNSLGFGVNLLGIYGSGAAQQAIMAPGGSKDLFSLVTGDVASLSGLFYGLGLGQSKSITLPNGTTKSVNSVNGLIRAIASDNNNNILSTPQILALDNEDATFEAGETVPTVVRETAANGSSVNTPGTQKVALTLKLTPQINKVTRMIKLKIDQKVDDFSSKFQEGTIGVGTNTRQAVTTVIVRDRDTIAMGGMMRDKITDNISKIPLLGDIPILGWLFKSKQKDTTKVNILFFLTPKIMAPYEKIGPDQLKDSLNRRAAHLKNIYGDDDPNGVTVKGLYEKANKQAEGPLFDKEDTPAYIRESNLEGDEVAPSAAPVNTDVPDYKKIAEETASKKATDQKIDEKTQLKPETQDASKAPEVAPAAAPHEKTQGESVDPFKEAEFSLKNPKP